MNLNQLLQFLSCKSKLCFNLHDASGILSVPPLKVDPVFKMHAQPFCSTAKATKKGYFLCTRSKALACQKAIQNKEFFYGTCPYGVFELVYPIVAENKVVCILFIGNQTENLNQTKEKAKSACKRTQVDFAALSPHFKNLEPADKAFVRTAAELIESYIQLTLKCSPPVLKGEQKYHWAIANIKEYADAHFNQQITLKELSKLYFLNEKYAGRLFQNQVGLSFHRYLAQKRLSHAGNLLKNSEKSILNIALESGFNSISYFNRLFYQEFHVTPGAYRKN